MENVIKEKDEFPLKGFFYISTVYPVIDVDERFLEIIEPSIENAYDLRGKLNVTSQRRSQYFPAPLCYPFTFSGNGLKLLKKELKKIDKVDSLSIKEEFYPNIPENLRRYFESEELKIILKNEKYISFKFKGWDEVNFLRFPTFLVVSFDSLIKSFQDYEKFKASWREKIKELYEDENFRKALGLLGRSRMNYKWSSEQTLTFVGLPRPINNPSWFMKRYIGVREKDLIVRREVFLREISLMEFTEFLNSTATLLYLHQGSIVHEVSSPGSAFRIYYSDRPIFYEEKGIGDTAYEHTTHGSQKKILKNTLLINTVLPYLVERLEKTDNDIKHKDKTLWDKRMKTFKSFKEEQIDNFHSDLDVFMADYRLKEEKLKKIREIEKGIDQTITYFKDPFEWSSEGSSEKFSEDDYSSMVHSYNRFFHFEKAHFYSANDIKQFEVYATRLTNLLKSVDQNMASYKENLGKALELSENRKNLVANRKHVLYSIGIPALGAILGALGLAIYWWR